MNGISPQQLAAMQAAAAQASRKAGPETLTVAQAIEVTKQLSVQWGTAALYYGAVPLLFYTGARACGLTMGDIVASVVSLPLT